MEGKINHITFLRLYWGLSSRAPDLLFIWVVLLAVTLDQQAAKEKIPYVQGQEQQLHFAGWGWGRYPTSNVRETPQWDCRHWSSCEEMSLIQGRRSPSKMVEGVNSHLESDPIPTGDAGRAQAHLGDRTVFQHFVEVWVSSGLLWGQGLWVQQTSGMA